MNKILTIYNFLFAHLLLSKGWCYEKFYQKIHHAKLTESSHALNLIRLLRSERPFVCLSVCLRDIDCSTASFNNKTKECHLYKNISNVLPSDLVSDYDGHVYSKVNPISTTQLSPPNTTQEYISDSIILTQTEINNLITLSGFQSFRLLYRGSRDGFLANDFHNKCDGFTNTITLVKSNLNYVFGGYTSVTWDDSNDYKYDNSSFLFILRKNGTSTTLRYNVLLPSLTIYSHSVIGPSFGGGHDIYISNNSAATNECYTKCYSYECPVSGNYIYHDEFSGSIYFSVNDIEVYQGMNF